MRYGSVGSAVNGVGEAGEHADPLYMDVIGRMKWFEARPGALNAAARDFDVLDDDTVAARRSPRRACGRATSPTG